MNKVITTIDKYIIYNNLIYLINATTMIIDLLITM